MNDLKEYETLDHVEDALDTIAQALCDAAERTKYISEDASKSLLDASKYVFNIAEHIRTK